MSVRVRVNCEGGGMEKAGWAGWANARADGCMTFTRAHARTGLYLPRLRNVLKAAKMDARARTHTQHTLKQGMGGVTGMGGWTCGGGACCPHIPHQPRESRFTQNEGKGQKSAAFRSFNSSAPAALAFPFQTGARVVMRGGFPGAGMSHAHARTHAERRRIKSRWTYGDGCGYVELPSD